jgi:hypothetical protein
LCPHILAYPEYFCMTGYFHEGLQPHNHQF